MASKKMPGAGRTGRTRQSRDVVVTYHAKGRASPRVSFLPAKGADVFRVTVGEPHLERYIHGDLHPANVLSGAGLQIDHRVAPSMVVEAGFPASAVRDFALAIGMTLAEISPIVGTSERTMSRKIAADERLQAGESDRVYRLFDATARAVQAFGDVRKAQRWLRREVPSLAGRRPLDLLRTEIGTREVLSALDRIQYGGVA